MITLVRRFIGFIIDVSLIYSFSFSFLLFLKINIDYINLMIFSGFYSIIYFVLFWVKFYGKTPGSNLMGVKVVRAIDTNVIDFKTALFRAGILFPFICPISMISILGVLNIIETLYFLNRSPYKEKQQTAWDVVCKTFVIGINSGINHDRQE